MVDQTQRFFKVVERLNGKKKEQIKQIKELSPFLQSASTLVIN